MPVSDYIQNGNSQMFLQSVFSAHYLDIFYIYMPLTSTVTFFLNLDFLIFGYLNPPSKASGIAAALFQIAADNMISFPMLS